VKLSEFVKKRRAELGLTWNDIMDGGIAHNTFSRIVNDKQLTMKASTMEKLARILKCTIGELQACMAEVPNPLRKEAELPEGNAGISITARAGKSKKDEVDKVIREKPYVTPEPAPDSEEPAEVFQVDEPEVEPVDMMFPVETELETDNRITREVAEECYKRKLKDKVGKILASTHHELTDKVRQEIGVMLLQELWGDNE